MNDIILRVKNLTKRYDDGFSLEITEREFEKGKIYCLVGPNGAGKTTFLNILGLIDRPSEGDVFFGEERVTNSNSLSVRRKISLVMENPFLFHASVFNNVCSGLKLRAVEKKAQIGMAKEALKMVGLGGFEARSARELSRGEAQRAAIARAVVFRPQILLLDEPFTNIDKQNIGLIESLIKIIREQYLATVIFTTHDFMQASRLSDEVISLVDGKIIKGGPENIFSGEAEKDKGLQLVRISPHISIAAITEKRGRVRICIHPQDIILSKSVIDSSARNSFKGRINKIYMENDTVRVNIALDKGLEFIVLVTKVAYETMRLTVDTEVFLAFKATAVTVFD